MNYILAINEEELNCLKVAVKEELKQWKNMKDDYGVIFGNTVAEELVDTAKSNITRLNGLLNKLNSLGSKGKGNAVSSG